MHKAYNGFYWNVLVHSEANLYRSRACLYHICVHGPQYVMLVVMRFVLGRDLFVDVILETNVVISSN